MRLCWLMDFLEKKWIPHEAKREHGLNRVIPGAWNSNLEERDGKKCREYSYFIYSKSSDSSSLVGSYSSFTSQQLSAY